MEWGSRAFAEIMLVCKVKAAICTVCNLSPSLLLHTQLKSYKCVNFAYTSHSSGSVTLYKFARLP